MNPKKLNRIAIALGLVVMVLVSAQFMKTYQSGSPKWNYLFMMCGMGIILFYSLFRRK